MSAAGKYVYETKLPSRTQDDEIELRANIHIQKVWTGGLRPGSFLFTSLDDCLVFSPPFLDSTLQQFDLMAMPDIIARARTREESHGCREG